MTKIILILVLGFISTMPACEFEFTFPSGCTFAGTPGAPYRVRYPDGVERAGTIGSGGQFSVSSRGYGCNQITVLIGSNAGFALSADPSSVYLPSPPTSGTITGQGFDATYGMPKVDYFDANGYLVDSVYATSVTGGGTSLTANFPDLSSVYSGTYQIKVTNKRYEGYYLNLVGSATMTGWGRDRPDTDGDGWYDDIDCDPYDPFLTNNCGGGGEVCGGGEEPIYVCP